MDEQPKERAEGEKPADIPADDAKKINMNNSQNAVDAMGNFLEQNFGIEGFSEFAKEHPFVGTVLSLLNVGMHLGGGDLTTILSTTVNKPRKSPEETDEDGDDNPLTKTINEITAKYTSQIEQATTDDAKKEVITKMFTEIFQELKKQSETTTVFETYVDKKKEQKKQLDKKENEDLTDDEKTQCIDESFKELTEGVAKDTKLYMKLNLEKIKYECEYSTEDVKVVDVLQKIAESFPDSKKYAINKDNIANLNDTQQLDLEKGVYFRSAMNESGMIGMMLKSCGIEEVSEEVIKKYLEALQTFERTLKDELGNLNHGTDEQKKRTIKSCYETLKNNVGKLSWPDTTQEKVNEMIKTYITSKGGIFENINEGESGEGVPVDD